jgi:hypothetical protein
VIMSWPARADRASVIEDHSYFGSEIDYKDYNLFNLKYKGCSAKWVYSDTFRVCLVACIITECHSHLIQAHLI